jgi:hypothetical protein
VGLDTAPIGRCCICYRTQEESRSRVLITLKTKWHNGITACADHLRDAVERMSDMKPLTDLEWRDLATQIIDELTPYAIDAPQANRGGVTK